MSDKKADAQARAELLGQLLNAMGEPAYMLVHGEGRQSKHLVLVRVTEAETQDLATALKRQPSTVTVGEVRFLALPLQAGSQPGDLPAGLYDGATQRWTGSIAVRRFQ